MDKEFDIGAGPMKGKKVKMHIPTGHNTINLLQSLALDMLDNIISPVVGIEDAWADVYLADLYDYDRGDDKKRTEILNKIAKRYKINRELLDGYQDSPLVVFALLALEAQAEEIK